MSSSRILVCSKSIRPIFSGVRCFSFNTDPPLWPVSKNMEYLKQWRKKIHEVPLKSPFTPITIPDQTLHEVSMRRIWHHSVEKPGKIALMDALDNNKKINFGEFYMQAHSVSSFLRKRGVQPGEVIATVLPNCIEGPIFQVGVWAAGGTLTGASTQFTVYETEKQFLDSKCTVVFTDVQTLEKVQKAVKNCENFRLIICMGAKTLGSIPKNVVDWLDVLATRPTFDLSHVSPDSIAILPYSSGTTGSPKGVMLSHRAYATQIFQAIDHWEKETYPSLGIDPSEWNQENSLTFLPNHHIFGFSVTMWNLWAGRTNVLMDKFDPVLFLQCIQSHRPVQLFVVPAILSFLAKHPAVDKFDISSVQQVITGAAPCGNDLCEEFLERHKNVKYLSQGYGMTEVGLASHLPMYEKRNSEGSVGVVAAAFEQKTVDPETGRSLGVGERGEICVRSATLMAGYLNQPKATAETIDREGWLHTGDMGYYDEQGYTYVVDRVKELIKVKGLQVAPAELEDLLLSHHDISDAAIVGIPDPAHRVGELVRAFVVRSSDSLSEQDVIDFVARKVSSHKRITGGVKFVDAIPRTASGKILRKELRDEENNAPAN